MDNTSIMSYLPEEQQALLRELIKKYGIAIREKQKYRELYEKGQADYDELKQQFAELKEVNESLRTRITTSQMAFAKAKEFFKASKTPTKRATMPINSSSKQQVDKSINSLSGGQTFPKQSLHSHSTRFELEGEHAQSSLRHESASVNCSSTTKKQEILSLKKQIQDLTDSIKSKKRSQVPFDEKLKQCEEIKLRFMRSKEKKSERKKSGESVGLREDSPDTKEKEAVAEKSPHSICQHQTQNQQNIRQSNLLKQGTKSSPNSHYPTVKNQQVHEGFHNNNGSVKPKEPQGTSSKLGANFYEDDELPRSGEKSHKKPSNINEIYQDSFYDIIKQLNEH